MRGDAVLSESCVRILKPCRDVRSMTSRPPTNVPASVHQRLLNLARQTNRPFNELLQYFAIQRFLFRFSRSAYAEQFVLKGAQMLQAWDAPLARPTMDIDMLGRVSNTVENLEQIVRACATVEVDADGVEFDPQSVRGEVIVKGKGYEGVRTLRVSPNVGQKTGLNKVVVGTFEMGTDSSRFRSELKPPHLPLKSPCPHLDQRQKIVYRANTRAEFPPFARHHKF